MSVSDNRTTRIYIPFRFSLDSKSRLASNKNNGGNKNA